MKNIQITSTVVYYLAKKLKEEFNLGYINNVQTIDKNIWKIKIHSKKTKELIVTPEVCFIPEHTFPVSEILGFEKYLKKTLYNQRVHDVFQDKNNKVVCFKLDKYNLIFEFFSKSNVILTDVDFKIITSKQKEEWKDRTIKKGENYLFPSGEDLKRKTKDEIILETKEMNDSEKIKYLAKKYNIAPVEVNEAINNKKEIISTIFENYNLTSPGLKLVEKEGKETYIITENGKDLFKTLEKDFKINFEEKEKVVEIKKKSKVIEVLELQENKKKEFEEKIGKFEKEGEFIYSNFTLIDLINQQIAKAVEKKVSEKEIIIKLNNYFLEKKIKLKINYINQKTKTYQLEEIKWFVYS